MVDKHRKHLENVIRKEVTKLFESNLDYTQIACHPDTYKPLRSKILRTGNDCIRSINAQLLNYEIKYIAKGEEIIRVKEIN